VTGSAQADFGWTVIQFPGASGTATPLPPTAAPTISPTISPVPTPTLTLPASPTPAPTAPPSPTAIPTPPPPSGFVNAKGTSLELGGAPYRFNGVNRYNLLTVDPPGAAPFRGCGGAWTDAQLAAWFAELPSMNVNAVRLWAFQLFTASGTDFSRMDYLLALAGQHNVKVI